MEAPPPVPINDDNVPIDLVCSICMTVPADPRITPCNHLFCNTCLTQALAAKCHCPIDRLPCSPDKLRELGDGLLARVWGGIQVKCGYHENGCAWRGSIADYTTHTAENCTVSKHPMIKNNAVVMEELEKLRRENDTLRNELDSAQNIHEINAERFRNVLASTQKELTSARENFEISKLLVEDLHSLVPRADGVDETTENINLVMRHTACNKAEAARALSENDNKVVNAIVSRTRHIKDIALVVSQTGCSRKEAVEALIENENDLINTIMALTSSEVSPTPNRTLLGSASSFSPTTTMGEWEIQQNYRTTADRLSEFVD